MAGGLRGESEEHEGAAVRANRPVWPVAVFWLVTTTALFALISSRMGGFALATVMLVGLLITQPLFMRWILRRRYGHADSIPVGWVVFLRIIELLFASAIGFALGTLCTLKRAGYL